MNIRDYQTRIVRLIDKIDTRYPGPGHSDNLLCLAHATEELGEVAREIYNDTQGRDEVDIENLGEEIADTISVLAKIADNYHIDLEQAIKKKMEKLKERHNLQNA